MNSSTGDFIDLKKSTFQDEIYTRGTQSCVKSKPYFQKKLMPLQPLNLEVIKKELEESWNEPLTYPNEETDSNDCIEKIVDEPDRTNGECNGVTVNNVCRKNLSELSVPLQSDNTNSVGNDSYPQYNSCNNHNVNLSVIVEEKENLLTPLPKKNDSFDLDFSALTLKTPVKGDIKGNAMYNTQYKIEDSNKKFEFLTPKVKATVTSHNSLSKKNFKTPSSITESLKKIYTPANSLVTKPMSTQKLFRHPYDDLNLNNDRLNCGPMTNPTADIFNKIKVNSTEYLILNSLGKGGSSEVFHGYNIENKYHVAIKCVSFQNLPLANGYINEVQLLQQLQSCDKIIKMYDYEIAEVDKKLLVVLEKGGEDLSKILKRLSTQQSHLPMYMLIFYWMEMLYAVKQMHSHGIIHSDLKPANFLKADGGLKLIDFGIASSVQTDMTCVIKSVQEGSCNYISPEALSNETANTDNKNSNNAKYKLHYKSDVWSLGCILYQLVYRRTPFQHINQLWAKLAAIMNPDYKIDYPEASWVSPKIVNTIRKCLQHNVRSRPSIDELVEEYESILNNI